MQTSSLVLTMAIAVGSVTSLIYVTRRSPGVESQRAPEQAVVKRMRELKEGAARNFGAAVERSDGTVGVIDPTTDLRPPLVEKPPFPKAATMDRNFNFRRMAVGEERRHTFWIENQGQAPLVIGRGPTECKCTISSISRREIPPGESAEVDIRWAPREADPAFEKAAVIWTNDPKSPLIRFEITGQVLPHLTVSPATWNAGPVTDTQEGRATGTVTSEFDENLRILSVEPTDPRVRVEYEPMPQSELIRRGIRSGYEFKATVARGIHIGRFRSGLRIQTNLEGHKTVDVEITARRSSPIRLLPAVPIVGNAYWNSEKSRLNLGRFPHETGSKAALPALITGAPDKLRVLDVKSKEDLVKVVVEPNPEIDTRGGQGVRFVFEVPPGAPPVTRLRENPVHVALKTNHPTQPEIEFDIEFVSQ